jgi:hypothetical protein
MGEKTKYLLKYVYNKDRLYQFYVLCPNNNRSMITLIDSDEPQVNDTKSLSLVLRCTHVLLVLIIYSSGMYSS